LTAQGSPRARFKRAIEGRWVFHAELAAREAGNLTLSDVWWLPRPPVSRYPGGFPRNFEAKLSTLLGDPPSILQPFGGRSELGVCVDINPVLRPDCRR
jgi:hypothetical protein